MNARMVRSLLLAGLIAPLAFASTARNSPQERAYAPIYAQATNRMDGVVLFKPKEPRTDNLNFTLAPLILQEVSGPQEASRNPDRFGKLEFDGEKARLDSSQPVVYFTLDAVLLHGQAHARATYLWFYSIQGRERTGGPLPAQGVRITLDSSGRPGLWEMLADASGAAVVFASQSLEADARAQYGPPLPGRRFCVEPGLKESPKVVVARVVDDGPVPMGPMVYLRRGTRCVSTLTCRCMPAQAAHLMGTQVYTLVPVAGSPAEPWAAGAGLMGKAPAPPWPRFPSDQKSLDSWLRLPRTF